MRLVVGARAPTNYTLLWDTPFTYKRDFIGLQQVCRFWCNVVIQTPSLWNNFKDGVPSIQWCRFRHVSVSLSIFVMSDPNIVGFLWSPTSRIERLHWDQLGIGDVERYSKYTAPRLCNLFLRAQHHTGWREYTLFGAHTVALRRLALHCFHTLPKNNFANLRHLELAHGSGFDPDPVLHWLAASPLIENLVLWQTIY
ncbi:hypothetical protein OBBRIDRAFT_244402 [Obba rivulosa]|uniref:F-box domain-containing protein n=1 Tax=Obba rivulosa TaxID=1052685 RepID=A0A8E2AQZ2_9APHY|nr:hypothetical protein OBBRIDRAFT_244402 [Obba rivulosa]